MSTRHFDFQKIEFISDIISWLWSGELKVAIYHNVRAIFHYQTYRIVTFRGFERMSQSENRNVSDRTPHFETLKSH